MISMKFIIKTCLCTFFCLFCLNVSSKSTLKVEVKSCSYEDEYFNYCANNYMRIYKNILKNEKSNFNKKYYLKKIGGSKINYSGLVVIDMNRGKVSTLLYGIIAENIEYNINSNIFCVNGEVNSKSLSFTKNGRTCFKYDTDFKIIE